MTDSRDDRARWQARYAAEPSEGRAPSSWVMDVVRCLPPEITVVDVAAGRGRHAQAIAATGRPVIAVDFIEAAVRTAVTRHPRVHGVVANAEALPFRPGTLDAIVVVNFLDRALVPRLIALLRPGGFLLYETYTVAHRSLVEGGRARAPRDPRYTLQPGELRALVAPLAIVDYREGVVRDEAGERACACVLARRDALA